MEDLDLMLYNKGEFIETMSGNKVSKKSVLCGSQQIRLSGKAVIKNGAMLRGDFANINVGKYSIIGQNTIIRPPHKRFKDGIAYFALTIGDYVLIEDDCVISAASIGSYVHIGKNCIISRRCILKDCCRIEDNTILPPDTVVPCFCVFSGTPGTYTDMLPECYQQQMKEMAINHYDRLTSDPNLRPTFKQEK